jgi:virulence factor
MLRVGVVGLGDIARKAYLPVLATRPDLEVHLCTRDPAVLAAIGDAYRVPHRHRDLDGLLAAGVDAAFVHAATAAHPALVERLLAAGVHVYVDKPLADSHPAAERLAGLARERDRSLLVGFNRRYAPAYAGLRDLPRDLVLMQKNRVGLPAAPRSVVFDDFIHVVDTLRFLAPGEAGHTDIRVRVAGGLLHHVVLNLSGDGWTALGVMNRVSGSVEESVEVMGDGRKRVVRNLAEVVDHRAAEDAQMVGRRGDWTPVARQRGIEQVCELFLAAVRDGRVLDAEDALRTHALCERIVAVASG